MGKYTLTNGLSTYLAMFYTHCYKLVAFIGFECIQIEPLVYNGKYKVSTLTTKTQIKYWPSWRINFIQCCTLLKLRLWNTNALIAINHLVKDMLSIAYL